MLLHKNLRQLMRLDELVQKKRSGTPEVLATKLCVSRRTVFRLIDQLKSLDAPICYCRQEQRYFYTDGFDLWATLSARDFLF